MTAGPIEVPRWVPSPLCGVVRAWLRVGHAISRVITPVGMALLFIAVFTPLGVARRRFGRLGGSDSAPKAGWFRRDDAPASRADFDRPF